MGRLSVRLTSGCSGSSTRFAAECGVTRTPLVGSYSRRGPEPLAEPPSEEELLARARSTTGSSWEYRLESAA
jgi:hypothetical protein